MSIPFFLKEYDQDILLSLEVEKIDTARRTFLCRLIYRDPAEGRYPYEH